jgi:hypothetical protein
MFLWPKDLLLEEIIKNNWSYWFFYLDETVIRVYGFPIAPHVLPRTIPNIIFFLEIIWKLNEFDKTHFRNYKKYAILPSTIILLDF